MKWTALIALSLSSACLAGYTATARTSSLRRTNYSWDAASSTVTLGSTTTMNPFSVGLDLSGAGAGSQVSTLQTLGATYIGTCTANNYGVPPHTYGVYTTSSFDLRFTVNKPTVFHIDGSLEQRFNASCTLLLQGIGSLSSIKYQAAGQLSYPPAPVAVHLTGTLPAGSYRLVMSDAGGISGDIPDTGTSSSFVFTVESCAGDLNADAVVDDSDFVAFAAAYDVFDCSDASMPAGCPSDLTHDGFVDDSDFVAFVTAYDNLLCP
ncbi:MAG: hypothetical protein U0573_02990 [Phycisphaerales bacterium]|nr:hypothetical protein [Planctomycetota bacterium]